MKKIFYVLILALFFASGCVSSDAGVECKTLFDCEYGFICLNSICVEGENNNKNDDFVPINDNDNEGVPDTIVQAKDEDNVVEKNDDDVTGGNKCKVDLDCDDNSDCTENKCESGYCFFPVKEEMCNGVDDNCNDETDETFEGMGEDCDTGLEGKCASGKKACVDGDIVCKSPHFVEPELCNGEDDNCDGEIDNFTLEEVPACPLTLGVCALAKKKCDGKEWVECTAENYGPDYSEEDPLDDLFVDSNCDGVDGVVDKLVFVDGSNGDDDLNDGTILKPLKTIAKGLEIASQLGLEAVLVAKGEYGERVDLVSGISIYGGFSGMPEWIGATENEVIISGDRIGISGKEVTKVLLNHLTIVSSDQTEPGKSSYGVFLYKSADVIIRNSQIIGGFGAKGDDGESGANGAAGGKGGAGAKGCEESGGVFCSSCSQPTAGISGKNNVCGMHGGTGGKPARSDGYGNVGIAGANSGGAGGKGGVSFSSGNTCNSSSSSAVYSKGGNGSAGTDGTNGSLGTEGSFLETGYVPFAGTVGEDGTDGHGGGGGGGGRGGTNGCSSYGSAGGGGGAGGCGGKSGKGGFGGGGSFGVYSFESTDIDITNTSITTLGGGIGGNGGTGGLKGAGGAAGAGGPHGGSSEQDDGGCGGWGGAGGAGGAGGFGGSGAGGPSYGIYSINSTIETDTILFMIGSAGKGGTSLAGTAPDGSEGDIRE